MLKALLFSLILVCTALPQYNSMYYFYNTQSSSSGGSSAPVDPSALPHKYYRINTTAWNGFSKELQEIQYFDRTTDLPTVATAYSSTAMNSSANAVSSVVVDVSGTGANLNNRTLFSSWYQSGGTAEIQLKLTFNAVPENPVLAYSIFNNNYPDRTPKDWTFEYSDDGTQWTILETRTSVGNWADPAGSVKSFIIGE